MIERFKRKFNSLYWHQFALTAGMVLLTLLLLGVSFFTLSYGTTTADKRGEMRTRAELIAQVTLLRCYSLTSLYLPLAALGSFPTSRRRTAIHLLPSQPSAAAAQEGSRCVTQNEINNVL